MLRLRGLRAGLPEALHRFFRRRRGLFVPEGKSRTLRELRFVRARLSRDKSGEPRFAALRFCGEVEAFVRAHGKLFGRNFPAACKKRNRAGRRRFRCGFRRKFECPPFPCRNRSAVVGVFGKQVCAKPHRQFFQACRRFLESRAFCAVFGHSLSNIGFEEISWQRLRKLACG